MSPLATERDESRARPKYIDEEERYWNRHQESYGTKKNNRAAQTVPLAQKRCDGCRRGRGMRSDEWTYCKKQNKRNFDGCWQAPNAFDHFRKEFLNVSEHNVFLLGGFPFASNILISLAGVQLNVRVTLSAGKGAFGVIPEWVQGVAAGQMDESWINKHGQLDSKGGPWQNAFPKSRSLPGAKQV